LAVEPHSGYILDSMGWVLYKKGQFEQALVYLTRAVAGGENDPVIFEHLGEVSVALGRFGAAVNAFEQALKNNHPKPEAIRVKLQETKSRLKPR